MTDTVDIIHKLLKLATNNPNEQEAHSAALRAARLIEQHAIVLTLPERPCPSYTAERQARADAEAKAYKYKQGREQEDRDRADYERRTHQRSRIRAEAAAGRFKVYEGESLSDFMHRTLGHRSKW